MRCLEAQQDCFADAKEHYFAKECSFASAKEVQYHGIDFADAK